MSLGATAVEKYYPLIGLAPIVQLAKIDGKSNQVARNRKNIYKLTNWSYYG